MSRPTAGSLVIPPSSFRLKIYYHLLFPLIIGLVISIGATVLIRQQEESIARLDFNKRASDATRSVRELFINSINVTVYLSALYHSSNKVTRKEFNLFAKTLIKVHPVVQALEWIPRVEARNLAEFERSNRLEIPGFMVTEKNKESQMVPVSKRQVYFPVQYVYPLEGNRQALGYDIASNKARKEMLLEAHRGNSLTASARIKLVQEKGDSFGILVTMPVYAQYDRAGSSSIKGENLRGYVLGVYRINEIIEQSLLKGTYIPSAFSLIDRSSPHSERLLYSREETGLDQSDWFTYIEKIQIAGRDYSIHISEKPQYFIDGYRTSTITFFFGLLITLLTAMYIALMRKRNLELYQSNYDLNKVMDEMKTLKGIIPICSYCHNIRDDDGAWEKLESYLTKYSEASFSHGICPKCLPKMLDDTGIEENNN